jgi:hypothetical protein
MLQKQLAPAGQLQKTLLFFLIAVFVVFLYTFLHEGGHALVGILSGGSVQVFNVSFLDLAAHVEMQGNFSKPQIILNNLAGVSLSVLVWLVFIIIVPKRANFALECLKVAGSLMFLSPLLAWIVLPMLFWGGQAPSDDVINFLNNSGVHPLWVSGAAFLLFCGAWALWSTRFQGLRQEWDLFRKPDAGLITPDVRKTALALLAIFVFCGLVAFGANGFKLSAPRRDAFQPPQGYSLVKQIKLSQPEAINQADVCAFQLDQPAIVGIYLLVEDVQADLLEVKLTGSNAYESLILHAEGYTAYRDNPHLEKTLPAGQYQCILTSRSSAGTLSIYTRLPSLDKGTLQ